MNDAIDTVSVEFTIRETTYYTGGIEVNLAEFEQIIGHPFDFATVTGEELYLYESQNAFGYEHREWNGDVDGQDWVDISDPEAEEEEES